MHPRLIYELIPPARSVSEQTLRQSLKVHTSFLNQSRVEGIVIPDIHPETGLGERTVDFSPKLSSIDFITLLRPLLKKPLTIIVNKVVVYHPTSQLIRWTQSLIKTHHLSHLVLVGGDQDIAYPGPSVTQATTILNQRFPKLKLGSICIPHRPHELKRMWAKDQAGTDFFLTQILLESQSLCRLLSRYQKLCFKHHTIPKPIILSLTPVTSIKNLKFLKWLRVYIPTAIKNQLLGSHSSLAQSSFQLTRAFLSDISSWKKQYNLHTPLGVNLSHILNTPQNIKATQKMIALLPQTKSNFFT